MGNKKEGVRSESPFSNRTLLFPLSFPHVSFWYTEDMKTSDSPMPFSLTGHVRNGVVVPDDQVPLPEGQTVRIEPISPGTPSAEEAQRAERVQRLQQLFAEWTEEDVRLSDEEADCLHRALEQQRGIQFRSPTLD